jgi:hypothetical protein
MADCRKGTTTTCYNFMSEARLALQHRCASVQGDTCLRSAPKWQRLKSSHVGRTAGVRFHGLATPPSVDPWLHPAMSSRDDLSLIMAALGRLRFDIVVACVAH